MARFLPTAILILIASAPAFGASGWKPQLVSLRECTELTDVAIVPHGFFVRHLGEFVPQSFVRPSADGRFWRCIAAGRTDLLAPAASY